MEKAFHFNNCFVDILANAFCPPLFSSLPFLLSSFKMTGDRAFSLGKELRGDSTVQACSFLEDRTKAWLFNFKLRCIFNKRLLSYGH